jgi:CrcB protein
MKLLWQCLAIGIGGSLGALTRFIVASLCGRLPTDFPVGTLLINLSGSLFLGWFLTATTNRLVISDTMKIAIGVGFVGAYTTFSTFMYESHKLVRDGETIKAGGNLIGSVILGLIAVQIGVWLASK